MLRLQEIEQQLIMEEIKCRQTDAQNRVIVINLSATAETHFGNVNKRNHMTATRETLNNARQFRKSDKEYLRGTERQLHNTSQINSDDSV